MNPKILKAVSSIFKKTPKLALSRGSTLLDRATSASAKAHLSDFKLRRAMVESRKLQRYATPSQRVKRA